MTRVENENSRFCCLPVPVFVGRQITRQ